jgi:hypothetical protein
MLITNIDVDRLSKGIGALSKAGDFGWFHGHFGAAIIASELFISENDLNSEISSLVRNRAEKIISSEPELFCELKNESMDPKWKERILEGLNKNLNRLRTSGHGVIYGALALKILTRNEKLATKPVIDGIVKLLDLATHDNLNRYYGIENYDNIKVEPEDKIPAYTSELDLIRASFHELSIIYPDQIINGKTYFFTGCKLHAITHAHALCTLNELGYSEMAKKGYENHRLQLKLNRHTPPKTDQLKVDKFYDPVKKDYWEREIDEPHYFKFPYSVLNLLKKLPENEAVKYKQKAALIWSD